MSEDRDPQYEIHGDWLCLDTGKHNCGVGPDGHYGAHEPGCGLEPLERISVLLDVLAPVLAERGIATGRCIVHDQTYTTVCPGCRADEIAAEEAS